MSGCASSDLWITLPMSLPLLGVTLWALISAVRYRHWLWIPVLLVMPVFGACLYFFFHLHAHADTGFELPGARDRKRIKHLEAELARLDKAHLHAELGDLYYQMGKLDRALASYRAAMARDATDLDTRAHLGACLVRLGQAAEARPLLAGVVEEKPRHDHGYTMMALAEAHAALGDRDAAIATWKKVIAGNSYGRARVQLAELLAAGGDAEGARALLQQVVDDDRDAPDFHRRREAPWVRKAKKTLRAF